MSSLRTAFVGCLTPAEESVHASVPTSLRVMSSLNHIFISLNSHSMEEQLSQIPIPKKNGEINTFITHS